MNIDLPLPLAVQSGMEFGFTMAVGGLVAGTVLALAGMYLHHRRQAMWHETARIALEKGQPLPLGADELATQRSSNENDVRAGLISIATGIGLFIFLSNFLGRALGYVGAIPVFVGLAMLLNAALTSRARNKRSRSEAHDSRS